MAILLLTEYVLVQDLTHAKKKKENHCRKTGKLQNSFTTSRTNARAECKSTKPNALQGQLFKKHELNQQPTRTGDDDDDDDSDSEQQKLKR